MTLEGSSQNSQQLAIPSPPEQVQLTVHVTILFKVHFNVYSSMSRSPKWSLSSRLPRQNPVFMFILPNTYHMLARLTLINEITRIIWCVRIMHFLRPRGPKYLPQARILEQLLRKFFPQF